MFRRRWWFTWHVTVSHRLAGYTPGVNLITKVLQRTHSIKLLADTLDQFFVLKRAMVLILDTAIRSFFCACYYLLLCALYPTTWWN